MTQPISLQTEIVPAYAVLHLKGAVNTYAEEVIESEFGRLIDLNCPLVLLDFSEVDHINSAGITILIGVASRMGDSGGKLAAYGLTDHYRKIFLMVGLEEFIILGQDRDSLLKQLHHPDHEQGSEIHDIG